MLRITLGLLSLFVTIVSVDAQEINSRVTIYSDKVDGSLKPILSSLSNKLTEFINNRKWSDVRLATYEKINANITIIINEAENNERFKGEIQIQSNRPVYNSAYSSSVFNFRDTELSFSYSEFQPLDYNENCLESNLIAVVSFYTYIILGIDFDTFSPMGGTPFFRQAMNIVNGAQALNESGWKAFENNQNRYAIASDYTEEASRNYRNYLYKYHRLGLDEMALNVDKGRKVISDGMTTLNDLYTNRPNSSLLILFGETKLDELVNIYSKAPQEERMSVYKLLNSIYPTYTIQLEALKSRNY